MLKWESDSKTFKYKTIYTLHTNFIDLELLAESPDGKETKPENEIAIYGTVKILNVLYKKFETEIKGLRVNKAKSIILQKTLETIDYFAVNPIPSHDKDFYESIIKSLKELYESYIEEKIESQLTGDILYNMVKEFMISAGQLVPSTPTLPTSELLNLRCTLILEESKEVEEAITHADLIQIAKECCDLLYVIYGTAIAFGLNMNNASLLTSDRHVLKSKRLDIKKCVNDLKIWATSGDVYPNIRIHKEIIILLNQMILDTFNIAFSYSIDLVACFKEVHISNMSKVLDGIIKDPSGKVLKGPNYKPPNLGSILFPKPSS